ncbi:MAG: DUF4142 domain-containing protein [Pyrinomonadaceae bacterium]
MIKNISRNAVLALAGFGLVACNGTTTNTNTNMMKANSNAVVVNSNSNMMNSNTNMGMNTSLNTSSKDVSSADKEFMTKAAQGGMVEVKLGELAASKGQSVDVKAFGQKMVADHGKANDELKALAAGKGVTLPTDVNSEQKEMYDKLSKLSGAAFDKEYVAEMVKDHEKDVAEFQKQADSGTDSDVKAFATKTLPTLKSHLEMIKGTKNMMK